MSEAYIEKLGKLPLDELTDARNFILAGTPEANVEKVCKFLNYLAFRRKAQPSAIQNFVEGINRLHPTLDFKPLELTRY